MTKSPSVDMLPPHSIGTAMIPMMSSSTCLEFRLTSRVGLPPDRKPAAASHPHHVIPATECPQTANPPPSPPPITSFPRRRESGGLRAVWIHRNTRNRDNGSGTGRLNPLNCSAYRWYDVW